MGDPDKYRVYSDEDEDDNDDDDDDERLLLLIVNRPTEHPVNSTYSVLSVD